MSGPAGMPGLRVLSIAITLQGISFAVMNMNIQESWLASLLVVLGSLASLLLLRRLLFGMLQRVARRTGTGINELLVAGLRIPSLFLAVVLSMYAGIRLTDLPESWFAFALRPG